MDTRSNGLLSCRVYLHAHLICAEGRRKEMVGSNVQEPFFRKLLEDEVKIGSNRFMMAPNIDILGHAFWTSLGDAQLLGWLR